MNCFFLDLIFETDFKPVSSIVRTQIMILHVFQIGHFSVSLIMVVHQIVTDCMKQSQVLSIKPDSSCDILSTKVFSFFALCCSMSSVYLLWISVIKDA